MSVKHNSAVATVRAHAPRVGSGGPQCATAHEHDCASKRPDYSSAGKGAGAGPIMRLSTLRSPLTDIYRPVAAAENVYTEPFTHLRQVSQALISLISLLLFLGDLVKEYIHCLVRPFRDAHYQMHKRNPCLGLQWRERVVIPSKSHENNAVAESQTAVADVRVFADARCCRSCADHNHYLEPVQDSRICFGCSKDAAKMKICKRCRFASHQVPARSVARARSSLLKDSKSFSRVHNSSCSQAQPIRNAAWCRSRYRAVFRSSARVLCAAGARKDDRT